MSMTVLPRFLQVRKMGREMRVFLQRQDVRKCRWKCSARCPFWEARVQVRLENQGVDLRRSP